MKAMIKQITTILFIALFSLLLSSCKRGDESEAGTDVKNIEVTAGNPVKQNMTEYVNLNANTIYQKQEIIRATFQGYIEKSYKNIGDKINQGDVLFTIKTKEADAASNSKINSNDLPFNGTVKVSARTNGVLTELVHQTGDYVSDGDELAVSVDPSSLKIILEVPFQYTNLVGENRTYTISLPDGKTSAAKVVTKVPSIDPVNQTQKFILETANPGLPANLNVSVKVPVRTINDAITLPRSSVMSNETQTEFWVMKIINDSLAVKLDIEKGIESENIIQIKSPALNLNERFITEGAFGLPDTAKILIQKHK